MLGKALIADYSLNFILLIVEENFKPDSSKSKTKFENWPFQDFPLL